ncbi:MAG: hypothetical protein PF445_00715 [Melioribacteraceae bacterium]|nr:hypothetical protein [Melioribacteraceae bacterium]
MGIFDFISSQTLSIVGWTIIHSLWQGLLVSLLLSTVLIFVDKKNAHLRYIISYSAIIILFTISIRTFLDLDKSKLENYQNLTFVDSISHDNLVQNTQVSINPISSEKTKAVVSKYASLIKISLAKNINLIVLLWFAGIILLSIRLAGGIFYSQRLKFREVIPVNQFWNEQIVNLCTKFEITQNVKLLQSKFVKFPVTIGYFKPVILLPVWLISGILTRR